ncbi:hypothetical protein U9M48_030951 [Paspalum notatum var. saurae]|uniref:Uncharacterized protein n=1 Tax=Paspalum notatum var. saurae TaxID=547442 RepID=A0AAQ3U5V7_PASNO
MYNLSRVFKTDISAVLTVKSGPDPHGLEFRLQGEWLTVIMIRKGKGMNPNQEFQDYDEF